MVSFDLCKGNPGALHFMMDSYMKCNPFRAEAGFQRMQDNGIFGAALYMLWNDCCNRDTEKTVSIMCDHDISDIVAHINYNGGRGIPYVEEFEVTIT